VNPEAYLKDTLTKIAEGHPINKINQLMPWQTLPAAEGKRPVAATLRRGFPSLMLAHGRRAGDAGAGRSAKDQS
jgi:hypothetical protein